jgi:hypothetical protein
MSLLHTQCLPAELAKPANLAIVTAAVAATIDGDETKVTAGTGVTVTGTGTTATPYVVSTPAPVLTLTGSTLSIAGGNSVTFPLGLDSQTLSVVGNTLTITGGNSVTLPVSASPTLSIVGQNLTISGGNTITLPDADTDAQTLSVVGQNLSISGGNTVALPAFPVFPVGDAGRTEWADTGANGTPLVSGAYGTVPVVITNPNSLYSVKLTVVADTNILYSGSGNYYALARLYANSGLVQIVDHNDGLAPTTRTADSPLPTMYHNMTLAPGASVTIELHMEMSSLSSGVFHFKRRAINWTMVPI